MKRRNRVVRIILFLILLVAMQLATQRIDKSLGDPEGQSKNSCQTKYVIFPDEMKKYQVYPWEILKLPDFNKSYKTIIGSRVKDKWLRLLDGPSSKNAMVATEKGNFLAVNSCKQNYCDTNFILILFDPIMNKCWALLVEDGATTWLGSPDDWMKTLLREVERLTWPNAPSDRFN